LPESRPRNGDMPKSPFTSSRRWCHRLHKDKASKGLPVPKLKYISSPTEIPAGQNYVLVEYGKEYGQTRHPFGLTITVARQQSKTVSELSFLTAVRTAKGIAKQEGISNIFAYTSSD
jgi:hypothetical protein